MLSQKYFDFDPWEKNRVLHFHEDHFAHDSMNEVNQLSYFFFAYSSSFGIENEFEAAR